MTTEHVPGRVAPAHRLWRAGSDDDPRAVRLARTVSAAAVALFTLVVCEWQPHRFFSRGGFSSDFYDVQARAFLHGRLDVPADIAGIEGFLVDGRTHLYFGPLLAVVRLPLIAFGAWADGRVSRLSMVVAFFALCTLAYHLAVRVRRLVGAGTGWAPGPAVAVALVAFSPALSLAGQATVYYETELWAFVLVMLTFVLVLDLWARPSAMSAVWAATAASATVLTRASVGLGAVAVVLVAMTIIVRRHPSVVLVGAGALAVGPVTHVVLNLSKFGSAFGLPADRQVLTLVDPRRAEWFAANHDSFFGWDFLPTTLFHYLRPDAVGFERLLPIVRFGPAAREFGGSLESYTPSSSLTAAATLAFLLFLGGCALIVRRRTWSLLAFPGGALVAAGPTLLIGFIAQRYLVDLLPILVVPAVLAATTAPRLGGRPMRAAIGLLVAWGAWSNVAFAVWLGSVESPGFTDIRHRVDGMLFDGAPRDVGSVVRPVPRDGSVAIDGPCDGLYVARSGEWVALELADGVRRVAGSFDPSLGPTLLSSADDGVIGIRPVGSDLLSVVWTRPDGAVTRGENVSWSGGPVDVEVVSDPVSDRLLRGLRVRIGDRMALADFRSPRLAGMMRGGGYLVEVADDRSTPVCNRLRERAG